LCCPFGERNLSTDGDLGNKHTDIDITHVNSETTTMKIYMGPKPIKMRMNTGKNWNSLGLVQKIGG
jgi:hypothetical protein